MADKLQTFIMVTAIAGLIWLYAEGENVRDFTNDEIGIAFVGPGGQELVISPREQVVSVDMRCATSKRAELLRALREAGGEGAIRIPVTADPENLNQTINLQSALERSRFDDAGITILQTNPQSIEIRVESMIDIDVPIKVVTGKLALVGEPTKEPATASVRIPSGQRAAWEAIALEARLDSINPADFTPNQQQSVNLALTLPKSFDPKTDGFVLQTESTRVIFTLENRTGSIELSTVPVQITGPPTIFKRFTVALDEDDAFLSGVELQGPTETINQIKKALAEGRLSELVWADFRLTNTADLRPGRANALPQMHVPPGVTVITQIPRVDYTIEKIEPPTPPGPAGGAAPTTRVPLP